MKRTNDKRGRMPLATTWHRHSLLLLMLACLPNPLVADVFVRVTLLEPGTGTYQVVYGGTLHKSDPLWYLPARKWPEAGPIEAGQPTPWFNVSQYAGASFHGRMNRAGGVAEFPYITANVVTTPTAERRRVTIEIATAPDEKAVVKRFEESYTGSLTGFLVSPDPKADADSLETAAQMTERRLAWAREASGGKRIAPRQLILQTSLWGGQRHELNMKDCEVLWLLGFNVMGGQWPGTHQDFPFGKPMATHNVFFGPAADDPRHADNAMRKLWESRKSEPMAEGMPVNFSDEIIAPVIGKSTNGLAWFHRWLKEENVIPADLGVKELSEVVPIETPDVLRQRQDTDRKAANRIFYYTSRFRQAATTTSLKWLTDAFHQHFGTGPLSSTLVADHPYFSGTGLGMGMGPNPAWSSTPLAADWFDLARRKAVDLIGIEDWMGLQYMYGPKFTWEGFQLMGFQAAIFRSGSRGELPIIAWITPSDETNLVLKSSSALCQGARNFFYWSYGPTATCTENYWSDLRPAYDGIVRIARQLAGAEKIIAPGKTRATRLAVLYSISSDLWQPFGYVHMLERRLTYLSLIHDQYLVDFLSEEDVLAGRLKDYSVLYVTDPCVQTAAMTSITDWVRQGGHLYGSCAAGSRNEFNEEVPGLASVFGINPGVKTTVQSGDYHLRAALNPMSYTDTIQVETNGPGGASSLGVIGLKAQVTPIDGVEVTGRFKDGQPAVLRNGYGKGKTLYIAACPSIAYGKEARFVPRELAEKWPAKPRDLINDMARSVPRLVELSEPVVESGVYDAPQGTALVLANFTYQHIPKLQVRLGLPRPCKRVQSLEHGSLPFKIEQTGASGNRKEYPVIAVFETSLDLNDVILLE
jgi:hypothetical protein